MIGAYQCQLRATSGYPLLSSLLLSVSAACHNHQRCGPNRASSNSVLSLP